MVTVINYKKTTNKAGEEFFVLDLQGDVEMLRAVNSGKFYAHARKASITSTLNEMACKALVGTKFPGTIIKVACEAYDYIIAGTSETITLEHTYQYDANESATIEEAIYSGGIN